MPSLSVEVRFAPQCGFAISVVGNAISVEDECAKLRTIAETAVVVWA